MKQEGPLPWHNLLLTVVAAVAVMLARGVAHYVLSDVPHVMDEVVYDFQARLYSLGRLTAPEVVPRGPFNYWFIEDRGARYGVFPPGWPVMLAGGYLLRLEEWVNPIISGITTVLIGLAARRVAPRYALAAPLIWAFSPQVVILAASRMSHSLVAMLSSAALLLVVILRLGDRRPVVGGALGVCCGLAVTTRPLCGLLLLLLVIPAMGLQTLSSLKNHKSLVGLAILGWCLPLIALAVYNTRISGNALVFPQTSYFDTHLPPIDSALHFRYGPGCNSLGFGLRRGCEFTMGSPGHTPWKALKSTLINGSVWIRLGGVFGVLPVLALLGLWKSPGGSLKVVSAISVLVFAAGYGLYWYPGTCYGARFYHAAFPWFVLVASIGVGVVLGRAHRVVILLVLVGYLFVSLRTLDRAALELADRYWGTDDRFARIVASYRGAPLLVLVAFKTPGLRRTPGDLSWTGMEVTHFSNGIRIGSALSQNSPMLDGRVVFAKYHPQWVDGLRARFPGRRVMLYIMADEARDDRMFPLEMLRLHAELPVPPDNIDGVGLP